MHINLCGLAPPAGSRHANTVGKIGEGRFDAFWGGVLGILVGAGIFAEVYSYIKDGFLKWGGLGKLTIPQVIAINHWIVILIVWAVLITPSVALEKKKL